VLNMMLGVTIASLGGYGSGQFVPPYFIREPSASPGTVGLIVGLIGGIGQGIGTLVGGFLTDRLSSAARAGTPGAGHRPSSATPIYILGLHAERVAGRGADPAVPGIFHYTYLGPDLRRGPEHGGAASPGHRHGDAVLLPEPDRPGRRPVFTGWLIDHLAQYHFNVPDAGGVIHSVMASFGVEGGQSFAATCPGGIAPKGSAPELAAQCRTTLALSSQQGIIVSLCFYAWAGLHYALAAIGMVKHMKSREPS
jgi:hypothetical protein